MATIVAKGVPVDLQRRLKERARRNGRRVKREVIACLEEWIGRYQVRVVDVGRELAEIRELRDSIPSKTSHRLTDRKINRAKRK